MKLIIQPKDGVAPLIRGIDKARKNIEIAIFRFDRKEVEHALENAAKRGVLVHALIADTNRSGEKELRKLETRLLAKGVTVARTSDDLVRYHGKMMIVDRKELYVLAFNFTRLDTDHSRSFGIITKNRELVQEAVRLFESDTKRQPYIARCAKFLVSPVNARHRLSAFIKGARHELLIYDSKISDRAMVRLLEQRAKAGVEVRIVGHVARSISSFKVHKLPRLRLHTRSIIRDRHQMFLGSQSLRELELDARREVGVIVRDSKLVNSLVKIFEEDWSSTGTSTTDGAREEAGAQATKIATRTAEAVVKDFPSVSPVVEKVVRDVAGKAVDAKLDHKEVEATVKDAVQKTIQEVVRDAVEQVATEDHPDGKQNVPGARK